MYSTLIKYLRKNRNTKRQCNSYLQNLTLEGPCIIFCNIYTFQRDTQCRVLRKTLYQPDVTARTIVCTYSIYKEAPEDGPLRSETCRADT